jgi:TRAP-type C4-dicarboxylate transport system permease small subunit
MKEAASIALSWLVALLCLPFFLGAFMVHAGWLWAIAGWEKGREVLG